MADRSYEASQLVTTAQLEAVRRKLLAAGIPRSEQSVWRSAQMVPGTGTGASDADFVPVIVVQASSDDVWRKVKDTIARTFPHGVLKGDRVTIALTGSAAITPHAPRTPSVDPARPLVGIEHTYTFANGTFKVGDSVTIVRGHNSVKGKTGTIESLNHGSSVNVRIGGRLVSAPVGSIQKA
jgi:hypothetical protein